MKPIVDTDISQHAFGVPHDGGTESSPKARGRGFSCTINGTGSGFLPHVAVWTPGTDGYNNVKVGAKKDAVLVALGVGNRSDIVNANGDTTGSIGDARFASAPFCGDVKKNEYNHYILLVDVTQNPARFVAAVDSKGDFLDEEYAETAGQKQ